MSIYYFERAFKIFKLFLSKIMKFFFGFCKVVLYKSYIISQKNQFFFLIILKYAFFQVADFKKIIVETLIYKKSETVNTL